MLGLRIAGLLLLVAGWVLVLSALVMLTAFTPRAMFVAAGLAVELLGMALAVRSYLAAPRPAGNGGRR